MTEKFAGVAKVHGEWKTVTFEVGRGDQDAAAAFENLLGHSKKLPLTLTPTGVQRLKELEAENEKLTKMVWSWIHEFAKRGHEIEALTAELAALKPAPAPHPGAALARAVAFR